MNVLRPTIVRTRPCWQRFIHSARGELISVTSRGVCQKEPIAITIGDSHESYVYVTPDAGKSLMQLPLKIKDDTYPLVFNHKGCYFTNPSLPYPRLAISQNLPQQSSDDTSPATMYCCGANYSIALDGTADAIFERLAMDSVKKLQGVFDLLKDM